MNGPTHALAVAGRGYRVFPVTAEKKPLIKGWVNEATMDRETLERWWSRWPDALVGIATGRGLVVVDLDVKNGLDGPTEWRTWCVENNLRPMTRTIRTRSSGQHIYRRTAGHPRNRGGLFPGVDIRGEGGYVVAWELPPAFADLPEAPEAVELLLRSPETDEPHGAGPIGPTRDPALGVHPYAAAAIRGELATLDECQRLGWDSQDGWNNTVNKAAWQLLDLANAQWWTGYSREQAKADLVERAPRDPDFGPAQHQKIWSSAVEGHQRDGDPGRPLPEGCDPDEPSRETEASNDFGPWTEEPVDQLLAELVGREPVAVQDNSSGWRPVDLAGYLDGAYQPPEAKLMHRDDGVALLYPGMTHSIHGESESGKSMW